MSNNDDFENDQVDFGEDDTDGGFEDFEGGGSSLGDMWRNNPLVKVGVIAGGLITIMGAILLFGGDEEGARRSVVRGGERVSAPPGGAIPEAYKKAVEEENVQRTESAIREGGSAIPTPVDTPVDRLAIPEETINQEDPLERWRRIQEERQRQVAQRRSTTESVNPYGDAINALAEAMAGQMEGILQTKQPLNPVQVSITSGDYIEREREAARAQSAQQGGQVTGEEDIVNILIPAGTVSYAQLITEANSDAQGPILAQLLDGPLAGSRLLGSFSVQEEFLVLNFNSIVIDGIVHPTSAVAMNPDTTSIGMVTDIDRRYFSRIILPAAAAFVEGMGEAISTTGTTVVVTDGAAVQDQEELDTQEEFFKGFEKASEKVGEILDERGESVEPLIRVEAGTPMGLLFVQPVTDQTR